MASELYTMGIWNVKAGMEPQFIDAWSQLARWTKSACAGAESVVLLQDSANPRRFVSVGPWRSAADVAAWRETDEFENAVAQMRPMLESFEPGTLTPVVRF
ncbi:MAG TPA: antibiotic biosynthesis monooxygenase family protein [Candidatus Baltobacteraceae bacterium]|nr:antibiotic biosynthesis monooxygenase family protein [Candidatus Baltobacteraceae bacterium]